MAQRLIKLFLTLTYQFLPGMLDYLQFTACLLAHQFLLIIILQKQSPEFEAIIPKITGDYFLENDNMIW